MHRILFLVALCLAQTIAPLPARALDLPLAVNVGTSANDKTGDTLRNAFVKTMAAVNGLAGNELNVRDFGAKDDDATDNSAAFTAAAAVASANGRTLRITPSRNGTGKFRINFVDWKSANVSFDEGAGLFYLDGTRYYGGYDNASGGGGLIGLLNPYFYQAGRRVMTPMGQSQAFVKPGERETTFGTWGGHPGIPYSIFGSIRDFFIYGQNEPSSGSVANSGLFIQVNNGSNGPGQNLTCTATNGSAVLTNCNPSPTGTHTQTLKDGSILKDSTGANYAIPNVYQPSKITGPGIPAGSYAKTFDATTITLGAAGSFSATAAYTGATGPIQINAQSGRSEFNTGSWHIETNGSNNDGGMNFYSDEFVTSNESDDPEKQEGFITGKEFIVAKQSPGLKKDVLHNGSYGLVVLQIPVAGKKTYTMHDGLAVTGWAGPPGVDGSSPGASAAAENGIRIGGPCASVFCFGSQRSWYKTGLNIQDYETGIIISQPKSQSTGTAIFVDTGAGNVDIRDNLVVGTSIIEPNVKTPGSSTAPCTKGQHVWDASFEYRCVATNTWKRAALAAW